MAEVRYADLHKALGAVQISSIGTVDGPIGGDGWQQVAILPQSKLPAGAGQYAILISGRLSNINIGPPAPASHVTSGLLQVCVGTTFGTLHPDLCLALPAAETLQPLQSFGFQFLLVISSTLADSVFGSSWNNDSGSELGLFARMYTNGAPLDWAGTFQVADTSFLWWDLARIPASEWFVEDVLHPAFASFPVVPPFDQVRTANAIGAEGQVWAVWHQSNYLMPAAGAIAPRIFAGPAPSGTGLSSKVAAGGWPRYGMSRGTAVYGTRFAEAQHGGMFVHEITNGTTKFALTAALPGGIAVGSPQPRRFRLFGVRVDRLPDLIWRNDVGDQEQGVSALGPWTETYVTKERPKPNPPLITEPILIASGECRSTQMGTAGYAPAIYDTSAGLWYVEGSAPIADRNLEEGVSSTVYARNIFTASSPALQLRTAFVGDLTTPTTKGRLQCFTFLAFHPIRDPDNQPTGPGTPPPPLIVNPGTQAPNPAALEAPPFPWNGDVSERGDCEVESIGGLTGYRRTWPLFTKPERIFGINWGPLGEADAAALVAWLRANPAWRFTAPGEDDAIAVLNMGPPEQIAQTHRTFTVSMTIAELVYTG